MGLQPSLSAVFIPRNMLLSLARLLLLKSQEGFTHQTFPLIICKWEGNKTEEKEVVRLKCRHSKEEPKKFVPCRTEFAAVVVSSNAGEYLGV